MLRALPFDRQQQQQGQQQQWQQQLPELMGKAPTLKYQRSALKKGVLLEIYPTSEGWNSQRKRSRLARLQPQGPRKDKLRNFEQVPLEDVRSYMPQQPMFRSDLAHGALASTGGLPRFSIQLSR